MIRGNINVLINEYGVKKEKIIEILNTNRVTFNKKYKDNSFSIEDRIKLNLKYGALLGK